MTPSHDVRPTRRQAAAALTAFAALALGACGSDGEAEFEDSGADAPQDPAPEQTEASDGGGRDASELDGQSTSDAGGEDQQPDGADQDPATGEVIDPDDAVATITYPLPGDEVEGTMTVGLHHLRRRGRTMELLLTYTPEFSRHETYTLWHLLGRNHANVAPALFDRTNLKRYDILRSGGGWDSPVVWNSKQADHDLASGDTQAYWANFAAPEDDIETIDVAIPGAPEFEDVPIEQASDTTSERTGDTEEGQE